MSVSHRKKGAPSERADNTPGGAFRRLGEDIFDVRVVVFYYYVVVGNLGSCC